MPANTTNNFPTRYYSERSDGTPAGFFTDHQHPVVQTIAFANRPRLTYQEIADALDLQHWHWAQRAVEQHCRRTGEAIPRSYTRRTRRPSRTTPPEFDRRFGIEIEFNGQDSSHARSYQAETLRHSIVTATQAAGIAAECESYNHAIRTHWKMTTDVTVTGGEFVSPPMTDLDEVRTILNIIKQQGGTTGRNVGMHVHHNVTDFDGVDLERLVDNLQDAEAALASFVPQSRYDRTNQFGGNLFSPAEWQNVRNHMGGASRRMAAYTRNNCPNIHDRYRSFNLNPIMCYGTVEFRLLGHTLNTIKVRAWIQVGQALMRFTKAGHTFGSIVNARTMTARLIADGGLDQAAADTFVAECVRRNPQLAAA